MKTDFNISFINSSNTQIYVKPAQNRYLDEGFDMSTVNLTWKAISFIGDTLIIGLEKSKNYSFLCLKKTYFKMFEF